MALAHGSWVRRDWSRRRASLIALTLAAGVGAGGVMAAVAGAHRTATSLERLAEVSGTADVLVDAGDGGLDTANRISELPSVEVSGAVTLVFAVLDGVEIDLGLFLPRGDVALTDLERDVVVEGRRADRARADEVTINEPMHELLGIEVGDRLVIRTLTPEQVDAEQYDPPLGPTVPVTVTGITRGPGDLTARSEGNIAATPALYPRIAGEVDEFAMYVAVRLRPGATTADLEDDLAGIERAGAPIDTISYGTRTRPARQTIRTLAVGFAVLGAAAAVIALVTIALMISRHLRTAERDDATMRALGLLRRQREVALLGTILPVVVLAPLVAVAVAVAASPLTPIGLARRAEPDPGVRVDAPVLAIGAVATAAAVALAGVGSAVLLVRASRRQPVQRPSSAAVAAAGVGAPPAVVNGVALALDRRTPGLPVRSTLAALAVASTVAIGSVTFASSLHRLAGAHDRWGSPWDLSLDFTSAQVDDAASWLVADDQLAAVGRWDAGAALVDGGAVRAFAVQSLRGELGFSLLEGRQPGPGEVVLGSETARRSGVAIGDVVDVTQPVPGGGEGRLQVVGIGVFPEIDDGDFEDAVGLTATDFASYASVPDLFEASQLVVRIRSSASLAATESRLGDQFGPDAVTEARPVRPGAVSNVAGLRSIPNLLVGLAALLGLAGLAHAVQTAAERQASGFATLRALGMTPRQLWSCSLSQSLALTVAALVAGVPLGIAAGARSWEAVAQSIGVAPDPLVPSAAVAAVVGGAILIAVLATALLRRPALPTVGQ